MSRVLGIVVLLALALGSIGTAPVLAQTGAAAPTPVAVGGTVTDTSDAPIGGATVTLHGPVTASTTTGADGKYSLSVPPGVYDVVVTAPGFEEASQSGVTIPAEGLPNLNISHLEHPTFSSLRTIGRTGTTVAGAGPQFNTTPSSQATIGQQTFENQGDIQMRDILDETPGIVDSIPNGAANGGVPGSITYPNIRSGLSYETASLIDGHPVSVGEYGDYVTTFLNRFMFQDIEIDKGPGSVPTQITRSVNGTVNFRTWDPTTTPSGNVEFGVDAWGGKYANFRYSDTVLGGKLGFVLDYGTYGTSGPLGTDDPQPFMAGLTGVTYTDSHGNPISIAAPGDLHAPGATNTETGYSTTAIGCCFSMPTYFLNHSELGKLRWNFSDTTSITGTFLGSQSVASQNGNTSQLYPVNFAPGAGYSGSLPAGMLNTFYGYDDNFEDDYEINNEPIFEGEFRTAFHDDTILLRAYSALISRLQTNGDPADTPVNIPVYLYGTGTAANGQTIALNGLDPYGNPYIASVASPLYTSEEQDNLIGYTFEYDHPLGNSGNVLSAAADLNYSWTHVYTPGMPDTSSTSNIPAGSVQTTGTYQVRDEFQLGPKLSGVAAYYFTRTDSHFASFGGASNDIISFSDDVNDHNDGRLGLSYRADPSTNLRFAAGSALVPPFLGILNGAVSSPPTTACTAGTCPVGVQPGTAYVNSQGGLNIRPETSFGYDFGSDYRLPGDSYTVFSGDLYLTDLQNQFLKTVYLSNPAYTPPGGGATLPLYTTAYANLSYARYEGIEFKLERLPPAGFGYAAQMAFTHGFPYDVPPSVYQYINGAPTTNQGVVPGQNFGPNSLLSSGGANIPYSQGYGELNYHWAGGYYANIGMVYFGPNNSFNEPAFEIFRSTLRVPIHDPSSFLQFSVDNIFNTYNQVFDIDYTGVPYPEVVPGSYYATNLKGYGPRDFRLVLVHNFR